MMVRRQQLAQSLSATYQNTQHSQDLNMSQEWVVYPNLHKSSLRGMKTPLALTRCSTNCTKIV